MRVKTHQTSKHKTYKLVIDQKKWREMYEPYKKTILLFVTNNCNLKCNYCFNMHNLMNSQQMDLDYVKKIVKNNPKIKKYDIQGGEPLLHKNINQIISYLSSQGKIVSLYTNGYFLNKLKKNHKQLKICISFQSLRSKNKSLRPLTDISANIKKFENIYPIKLIFLFSKQNEKIFNRAINYVENNFKGINKITIGAIRDEKDYFNDKLNYVFPLSKYVKLIQMFINNYNGRLNVDIFTKGVLRTAKLPKNKKNQICRFRNLFPDKMYIPCLYQVAKDKKIPICNNYKIPITEETKCKRTGLVNCLADKICLIKK